MNYGMATKSRAKATFFAQFLGAFGAHKFYLGKTVPGILYLVFCWTGIPSIIALVESIILVTMSDYEFAMRHDPEAASLYPPNPVTPAGKKRSTAALIAMFLAPLGIHLFYLKKTKRGLMYLALYIVGLVLMVAAAIPISSGEDEIGIAMMIAGGVIIIVPAILGLIDYIKLVMKKDRDFLMEEGGMAPPLPAMDYAAPAMDYAAPAPMLDYNAASPVQDSYGQAWNQSPPADFGQPGAETVAYQTPPSPVDLDKPDIPAAPVIPVPPVVPFIPGSPDIAADKAPPAPETPKFFDNSYMPPAGTVKDSESYVPGDDNFHPSVLQLPEVNPATQMGAAASLEKGLRPCLKSTEGEYAGNSIEMDNGEICMGRDPNSCQLVFSQDSPFVSGRHCVISYNEQEDVFYLQDLGSTNGTFLMNDEKLQPGKFYTLKEGDGFYLGDRNTSFQVGKC